MLYTRKESERKKNSSVGGMMFGKKRRKSKELTVHCVFVQITKAVVLAFIYCDSFFFLFFSLSETSNDILY